MRGELSQKHAIKFPSEKFALALGLTLSLASLVRTMPASACATVFSTTSPRNDTLLSFRIKNCKFIENWKLEIENYI